MARLTNSSCIQTTTAPFCCARKLSHLSRSISIIFLLGTPQWAVQRRSSQPLPRGAKINWMDLSSTKMQNPLKLLANPGFIRFIPKSCVFRAHTLQQHRTIPSEVSSSDILVCSHPLFQANSIKKTKTQKQRWILLSSTSTFRHQACHLASCKHFCSYPSLRSPASTWFGENECKVMSNLFFSMIHPRLQLSSAKWEAAKWICSTHSPQKTDVML